jgi:Tetratricopeptide repeat
MIAALQPLLDFASKKPQLRRDFLEALNELANRIQEIGEYDSAVKIYQVAFNAAREAESAQLCSIVPNNLAEAFRKTERPAEAIPLSREAIALCDTAGDEGGRILVEHNLAPALKATGERDSAERLLKSGGTGADVGASGSAMERHGSPSEISRCSRVSTVGLQSLSQGEGGWGGSRDCRPGFAGRRQGVSCAVQDQLIGPKPACADWIPCS